MEKEGGGSYFSQGVSRPFVPQNSRFLMERVAVKMIDNEEAREVLHGEPVNVSIPPLALQVQVAVPVMLANHVENAVKLLTVAVSVHKVCFCLNKNPQRLVFSPTCGFTLGRMRFHDDVWTAVSQVGVPLRTHRK